MTRQHSSHFSTETPVPRYFEDVAVGDELQDLQKGPLTTAHLMRWSAAMENWHKIHYDRDFAIQHDGLPDLLVNGTLKQNFLLQIVKDWATPFGWPWKVSYQFRAMDVVGSTLTIWGVVKKRIHLDDFGIVELELGIRNQDGKDSTPGRALVALPYRGKSGVPYPFSPPTTQALEMARTEPAI